MRFEPNQGTFEKIGTAFDRFFDDIVADTEKKPVDEECVLFKASLKGRDAAIYRLFKSVAKVAMKDTDDPALLGELLSDSVVVGSLIYLNTLGPLFYVVGMKTNRKEKLEKLWKIVLEKGGL